MAKPTHPPLTKLAERYVAERIVTDQLGPEKARVYRSTLLNFAQVLSAAPAEKLTPGDLDRWLAGRAQTTKPMTFKMHRQIVLAFCTWLADHEFAPALRPSAPAPKALQEAKQGPTLTRLVDPYVTERFKKGEITGLSARNLRGALYRFAEVAGNRPVGMLGPSTVEAWLVTRERLKPTTRRGELSAIRGFCRWLVRKGYTRRDWTADTPTVRVPRYMPRALEAPKVAKTLDAVPDVRAVLMCLLMVQEGLRCVEVSRIQVGDVDFYGKTIRVVGKGSHERFLPLSDETMAALNAYLSERPATAGPLIRSYNHEGRGLSPQTISAYMGRWMTAAGIKSRPRDGVSGHALRHTMATDALRNGAHLRDVQAALGHAHLRATEVYLPLVVHDLRDAMGGRKYRGAGA